MTRYRIPTIGLDIGPNEAFRDAEGNSYGPDWTSKVGEAEFAAIGMEAYEPEPPPPPLPYVRTRVYKGDIWRRATDAEAVIIDQLLNAQPVRLRRLWQDSTYLDKNDDLYPLVEQALTSAFGAGRAADLLLATE